MRIMLEILMATYNGETYVSQQIESILNQTFTKWHLTICDDCSSDNTFNILKQYQRKFSDKITINRNTKPTGCACANFFQMLSYCDADYIMTCDQDDVWLPFKIEITFNKMKKLEKEYGNNIPLLVHTDLKVVDSNLSILSQSIFKSQKLNKNPKLSNILIQNNVTGCTMMLNKKMYKMVPENSKNIVMHDWWFALIAYSFGKASFIDTATVLYRQHGNNVLGAFKLHSIKNIIKVLTKKKDVKYNFNQSCLQADKFLLLYNNSLSNNQNKLVSNYTMLINKNKLARIISFVNNGYYKKGIIKLIGQFVYL